MDEETPTVNFDDLDPEFAKQVMNIMGERLLACFNCGCCTGSCPIVPWEMNMRKLIQKVILGFSDEVLGSQLIWFCSECMLCGERCPQDVKPYEVIIALRNLALQKGIVPLVYKVMAKNLIGTGRVTEFSEAVDLRRERLNIPKAGFSLSKKVVKDINSILNETKFNEIIKLKNKQKEE
ncbi:MAG: 4Fe-4S dicluster domain-containing protein [Candidatus Helarchaeota archaeon]